MLKSLSAHPLRLSRGFVGVSLFGAGILMAVILQEARQAARQNEPPLLKLTSIAAKDVDAAPAPKAAISRAGIDVDATRTGAGDVTAFANIQTAMLAWRRIATEGQSNGADFGAAARSERWSQWARIESPPAPLFWKAGLEATHIDAYALHSEAGAAVMLGSRDSAEVVVDLRVRLAAAPYKIEHLIFAPIPNGGRVVAAQLNDGNSPARPSVTLLRLKGRDLTRSAVVPLTFRLAPGEVHIVRFSDTAFASRSALNDVRAQLRRTSGLSPELARRLHVIFDGSGSCESAIARHAAASAEQRRGTIHRFLLVLGQAYSLNRNFVVNRMGSDNGSMALQECMDRLSDGLGETSATLTGLVPSITLAPVTARLNGAAGSSRAARDGADDASHAAVVVVGLSNQGGHTASLVKIGIDQRALPEGVQCEPAEPALFDSLAPGQTGRATYVLRWRGAAAPSADRCVGDVSFFSAGAPAHVHLQPW